MRHRAKRSILARLHRPALGRRGLAVLAGLACTAALTGVGVALQQESAEPSATGSPTTSELGTPDGSSASALSQTPSKAVSRGGDRQALPKPKSSAPSPTAGDPTSTSPLASSPTTLPGLPETPEIGTPSLTVDPLPTQAPKKAPTQTPTRTSSPSPAPPADVNPPQTTASTIAVDSDSWKVSIGADEPATFQCSLDGGGYRSCGAATTFSGLAHGPHSLTVRATDTAGNTDPTPASLATKITGSD